MIRKGRLDICKMDEDQNGKLPASDSRSANANWLLWIGFTMVIAFQPCRQSSKWRKYNCLILLLWLVLLSLASKPFCLHRLRRGKSSEDHLAHFKACVVSLYLLTAVTVMLGCLDGLGRLFCTYVSWQTTCLPCCDAVSCNERSSRMGIQFLFSVLYLEVVTWVYLFMV